MAPCRPGELALEKREGGITKVTVEHPNKGHYGANNFVLCREVVPISEGPYLGGSLIGGSTVIMNNNTLLIMCTKTVNEYHTR